MDRRADIEIICVKSTRNMKKNGFESKILWSLFLIFALLILEYINGIVHQYLLPKGTFESSKILVEKEYLTSN